MSTAVYLIVTAAGSSRRMGGDVPKPLLELGPSPVLVHALRSFDGLVERTVVTAPAEHVAAFEAVASQAGVPVSVVVGGAARARSVANGLTALPSTGLVLVHDAARPLVPRDLIERLIAGGREHGACIPVLPVVDTIKQIDDQGQVTASPARAGLVAAQTPQAFDLPLLRRAYEAYFGHGDQASATDDASLVERLGHPVHTVPGDERARKLTTPIDLTTLVALLAP